MQNILFFRNFEMHTAMEISVIVPVYNKEAYVERCIHQLMQQDFDDFEVVIVDDGSTDHSGLLCDQMAATDKRLRVFHTSNGGVTAARRYGLEHSHGRFIMFVDSDDELLPNAMHILHKLILHEQVDEVIGTYYDQYGRLYDTGRRGLVNGDEILRDLLAVRLGVCVLWGILFKREILDGCLNIPRQVNYAEDIMMQIACLMKRPRVFFAGTPIYRYYVGLPNNRQQTLANELLYDQLLLQLLKPRWDEFRPWMTLHQVKIYESFLNMRNFDACNEYHKRLKGADMCAVPLADQIVFMLPSKLAWPFVRLRKLLC